MNKHSRIGCAVCAVLVCGLLCVPCWQRRRADERRSPKLQDARLLRLAVSLFVHQHEGQLPTAWDDLRFVLVKYGDEQLVPRPLDEAFSFVSVRWTFEDFGQDARVILVGTRAIHERSYGTVGRYLIVQLDSGSIEEVWLPEAKVLRLLQNAAEDNPTDGNGHGPGIGAQNGDAALLNGAGVRNTTSSLSRDAVERLRNSTPNHLWGGRRGTVPFSSAHLRGRRQGLGGWGWR